MYRLGLKGADAPIKRATIPHFNRASAPDILDSKWSYLQLFPVRRDQGDCGACVGYAVSTIMAAVIAKHFGGYKDISARGIYSLTQINRETSSIGQDVGMYAADALWTVQNVGYALESDWPDQPTITPTYFAPPPSNILTKLHDIIAFEYVTGYDAPSTAILVDRCKAALRARGPLAIGGPWANDWMNVDASGNLVSNPQQGSAGGHERIRAAYDDNHVNLDGSKGAFLDINSWGLGWGRAGTMWFPYNMVSSFNPQDVYALSVPLANEMKVAA